MEDNPANNEDTTTLQGILDALDDPDCRALLRKTTEPMTAKELSDVCDIPKSTVYRKLNHLSQMSLVRERMEIHPEGGRITRYQRDFDNVSIYMTDDEKFDIEISRPKRGVDERLANIWSKMGDEL